MCDCEGEPSPVTDWAGGDVVCCACGVVLEGHILDEAPEWRNHAAADGGHAADRSRVGAADARLGTYLERGAGGKRRRLRDPTRDAREQALHDGLALVDRLVGAFGLSTTSNVAATARELFADLHEAKGVRSDTRRACAAAAVYYGCKLENVGRELRLVSQVCQVDAKALNSATSEYKAALADKPYHARLFATLQAGKLIDIFLDRLRLAPDLRRRAWRAAHQLDESLVDVMDCGRKPRTICSGILFVAAQQERIPGVGKKEITEACAVCQQTLDKVVAQIRRMMRGGGDENAAPNARRV
jgi:transcription initiation factor TFIIIB Brf1 subunit/transcription initiation factor TFIIB